MRIISSLILLSLALCMSAQNEKSFMLPDSISEENVHSETVTPDRIANYCRYVMSLPAPAYFDKSAGVAVPVYVEPFSPGVATIFGWDSGIITASGSRSQMPGLMAIESGLVNLNQQFGRWGISVGAQANKYAGFRFLHTQYGINASISYRISDRVRLETFGCFYFDKTPREASGLPLYLSPGIAGYYNSSAFGGFADISINDHWGIMVGAQAERQMHTGNYRVEPIATPYYRINKKVSIGLPVGQILYNILDNYLDSNRSTPAYNTVPSGKGLGKSYPGGSGMNVSNPEMPRPRH